jgi:hypothetical protein
MIAGIFRGEIARASIASYSNARSAVTLSFREVS